MPDYEKWVRRLNLAAHPEGGYYRETYRAAESIPAGALPPRYIGSRSFATAILFLLPAGQASRWHRLQSDETWHFYAGVPLWLYVLTAAGEFTRHTLGQPRLDEENWLCQVTIPAGHWFGARPAAATGFSLAGCTVAPGFDFRDFTLADSAELCRAFPGQAAMIAELTTPVSGNCGAKD